MISADSCASKTDEELVNLSLQNTDYYRCLLLRYEPKLTAYVNRLAYLAPADVEDILADSFIAAYRALADFDPRLKFSSWIYRIVHNNCVNFLKKHRLNFKISLDSDKHNFSELLPDSSNPQHNALANIQAEELNSLINTLDPLSRQVILLRFFEDKTYEEIGDILKKPSGTVATLISRSKLKLKKLYAQS